MNCVILLGRLGKDPEERTTQAGKSVCSFTVATDDGWGENKKTNWHNITCFDKTAENVVKYLKKGSCVFIRGRISYDTYEKDGVKKTATKIIADQVEFLPRSNNNAAAEIAPTSASPSQWSDDTFEGRAASVMPQKAPAFGVAGIPAQHFDDDIPF